MLKELWQWLLEMKSDPQIVVEVPGGDITHKIPHIRDGSTYKEVGVPRLQRPPVFLVKTLTGLIDFLHTKMEENPKKMLIHVTNPQNVYLYESKAGYYQERPMMCQATFIPADIPEHYNTSEQFLITLMTKFEIGRGNHADLVQASSKLVDQESIHTEDDGVTKSMTIQKGIANKENLTIRNPVVLAPYITFAEIDQPLVKYIYRMSKGSDGIAFDLIKSLDPTWAVTIMRNIKKYLEIQIDEDLLIGEVDILV